MKSVRTNIILILIFALFFACEEPAPIEIATEEPEASIEVINADPSSYVISGYDSTGVVDENSSQISIVTLSGIKNTYENFTTYKGYGEAVFLDTTKPIFNNSNRLVGYGSLKYENVKFGNKDAIVVPYILKYRENNVSRDSLVGFKHSVLYESVLRPENLNFPYGDNIDIQYSEQQGQGNSVNLKVPSEITGNIEINGSRERNNLRINLTWNKITQNSDNETKNFSEEIIIGGLTRSNRELIPLLKLDEFTSNKYLIANSLVKEINAAGDFEYLVITFIRKFRRTNSNNILGKLYFASQSIHNIWIKN